MTEDANWLELNKKVCVVTGAAGGIGAEIAIRLASVGAGVVLLDRDHGGAATVAEQIEQRGGVAYAMACDVTDHHSVGSCAERVQQSIGPCDVLVNNAAAIYADALMDIEVGKWDSLLSINLSGYLRCAQMFGRQMISNKRGSMVHVASISGTFAQPYSGAYSVSKAGVKMLSKLLAVELGEYGVRSNVVSPGMIETPMSSVINQDPIIRSRRENVVPVRRLGKPSDIADTVLFLSSNRSAYVNGQDIAVDGGLSESFLRLVPRPGFEKPDTQ